MTKNIPNMHGGFNDGFDFIANPEICKGFIIAKEMCSLYPDCYGIACYSFVDSWDVHLPTDMAYSLTPHKKGYVIYTPTGRCIGYAVPGAYITYTGDVLAKEPVDMHYLHYKLVPKSEAVEEAAAWVERLS